MQKSQPALNALPKSTTSTSTMPKSAMPTLSSKSALNVSKGHKKAWLRTYAKHKTRLQTACVSSVMIGLLLFASTRTADAAEPVMQQVKQAKAQTYIDLARVEAKAQAFLSSQASGYPGEVSVSVVPLDRQLKLADCEALEASMANGSRPWGKTSVSINCNSVDGTSKWRLYVQANVAVFTHYVVAAEPLSQGQVINANQIMLQNGDITRLPSGVFTELAQVIGSTAKMSLIAGAILRQDSVKLPLLVRQGQTVTLTSVGNGFQITAQGNAMNNAELNQIVRVKTASGKLVSGIANAQGLVEVSAQ